MQKKEESKERKRMVVEEVGSKENVTPEPKILDEAAKDAVPTEPEPITEKNIPLVSKETEIFEPRKSPSIALWIIVPGIFLLGAILGGIVFYQRGVNRGQYETPAPKTIPSYTPAASSTPSASIDLTKYTINIFNGSGIAGEAGKVKNLLTTAGFKVGSTGNASTYNYTKTIIKAKDSVDTVFISALSATLRKTYDIDSPQTLASSSADTVQVVVGKSKAQ